MSDTTTAPSAKEPTPEHDERPRGNQVLSDILNGSFVISILAVLFALVIGGILIAVTNEDVLAASGYFFAAPGDTFGAIWNAVSGAYGALFQGSVYNFRRDDFFDAIRPLTQTLTFATPLIAAACAGWVGFSFELPWGVHLAVALVAGIVGGALWAGLVGLLKARTGAHEVILTIMLNYVAFYLISWMLRTPGLLQAPDSVNPKSPAMLETAVMPDILGPRYNLHFGFLLVIAATFFAWWLLNRSSLGFQFRAVGQNPNAARVAGINVKNTYVYAMLISGGLVGLAGVIQVLGTVTTGFSAGIDAGIGFDAITVALLGRSKPWGIFAAGILFGAFKAGGFAMQAAEGIPIDIVTVVQSMIVLFIAAPPLIRAVFFLPKQGARRRLVPNVAKEVKVK